MAVVSFPVLVTPENAKGKGPLLAGNPWGKRNNGATVLHKIVPMAALVK